MVNKALPANDVKQLDFGSIVIIIAVATGGLALASIAIAICIVFYRRQKRDPADRDRLPRKMEVALNKPAETSSPVHNANLPDTEKPDSSGI